MKLKLFLFPPTHLIMSYISRDRNGPGRNYQHKHSGS